ncbi:hypothetical protein Rsub_00850 [Raphidocelis subcapitata]|uniref:Major facilitator superfamily (MFS) profile domain-containing protein n=1 Tax=Raphidocelis subcapitata TaxID=307507 RepID=A0A2V0NL71_9CHLO|nr:hypothetical protein Rsub_00850 [Raphidocelis subcapitata]|eukprot:GBF88138.1 hypothetical protein Rsub_00850 [Raphidocelis subcapitata]
MAKKKSAPAAADDAPAVLDGLPATRNGAAAAAEDGAAAGAGAAAAAAADAAAAAPDPLAPTLRKVTRNIVPLGMAIIFISNIDRSNLAYGALTFNRDNGFGPSVYSTAVSLFFVTYCVLQMPSNLVMLRVGYRPWLTMLLIGWGIVATCFSLVTKAWSLYLLRVLLGILEAGALPALWHVFAVFFPARRITVPFSTLSIAILLANMLASPLATGLLAMDGLGGLKGWQWLFLIEGIPAVLIGALTWIFLPPAVASARFLDREERAALEAAVEKDRAGTRGAGSAREVFALTRRALANPYVGVAFVANTMSSLAAQITLTFTPIIISNIINGTALDNSASVAARAGSRALKPVALTVVPYALAASLSLAVAFSAERRHEQFLHAAGCLLASGACLMLVPLLLHASSVAGFVALCLAIAAGSASSPPMMVLVARLCLGDDQAVVLPVINSAVVLGGIVGPLATGAMLNRLGGFTYVFVIMGALNTLEAVTVVIVRWWVLREGGLPDGGRNTKNVRAARRIASDAVTAAAAAAAARPDAAASKAVESV